MNFIGINTLNPYNFLFKKGNTGKKVNFIQSLPPPPPPTWDLGIEITESNQTFGIQINGISPNITVDWGDGTIETFTTTGDKVKTYVSAGNYTVKIFGSFQSNGNIRFNTNPERVKSTSVIPLIPGLNSFASTFLAGGLTSIPTGLFDNNPSVIDFNQCFQSCPLTSIPAGLFVKNTSAIFFSTVFAACSSLTSIPAGLFDNNTIANTFNNCFEGCSSLTSIPTGLFDNNAAVEGFSACFRNCHLITSVPAGLFANNISVTNDAFGFSSCFQGVTLTTTSYSNLLINMASNAASRQNNVFFGGGNSKYNLNGQAARQTLTSKSWTFTDGGFDTDNILFDTTSFVGTVPEPYLTALNSAVARWSTYIKFNPTIVASIRSQINSNWGGIKINSYSTINDSNSYIAACGVNEYIDIQGGGGVKFNTYTFNLFVNLYYASILNATDWANVMTHELGHALGIGIYWGTSFQAGGAVPPSDFFLSSTAYPSAGGAYNTILGSSRPKISLENEGGGGTASAHWENNFRSSSAAGSDGFNYPGLQNELMVGFYSQSTNFVISNLSIKTLVDFGYLEKNPGANEGNPTLVNS